MTARQFTITNQKKGSGHIWKTRSDSMETRLRTITINNTLYNYTNVAQKCAFGLVVFLASATPTLQKPVKHYVDPKLFSFTCFYFSCTNCYMNFSTSSKAKKVYVLLQLSSCFRAKLEVITPKQIQTYYLYSTFHCL